MKKKLLHVINSNSVSEIILFLTTTDNTIKVATAAGAIS
jgi:hypothetical protein